jgi:hypothetical protein
MNTKTAAMESPGTDEALEKNLYSEVAEIPLLGIGHRSLTTGCVAGKLHTLS